MSKFHPNLDEKLQAFISEQKMFFVATAPQNGRVNLSPKGLDSFCIIDEQNVAYLDLTGSGNETAAHLHENGRMTLMFCSFAGPPLILRLYGTGEVLSPQNSKWEKWLRHFTPLPGIRHIIHLSIQSVQTSCGYGVPLYEFQAPRDRLTEHWKKKTPEEIDLYQQKRNNTSIDGLPTYIGGRVRLFLKPVIEG